MSTAKAPAAPSGRICEKHPCRCSEDQDNLHYALITFVLRYTPHSGDKTLTQVIWVLRKPTRVFFLLYLIIICLNQSPYLLTLGSNFFVLNGYRTTFKIITKLLIFITFLSFEII